VERGYCGSHKAPVEMERPRLGSARRGYDARWQMASRAFLIEHPLCVRCEARGKISPATVTDHMIPHRGNARLFWDRDNWQALCKRCHDRKTVMEDGGFGRKKETR
jgi:5-methylcytosine-specific restriction protein A